MFAIPSWSGRTAAGRKDVLSAKGSVETRHMGQELNYLDVSCVVHVQQQAQGPVHAQQRTVVVYVVVRCVEGRAGCLRCPIAGLAGPPSCEVCAAFPTSTCSIQSWRVREPPYKVQTAHNRYNLSRSASTTKRATDSNKRWRLLTGRTQTSRSQQKVLRLFSPSV